MTDNAGPGIRIIGSLRAEHGAGVVRIEDRYDTDIGTSGRRSPIPFASPAGMAESRAISDPAEISASTSKPMTSTALAASTRANHRGGSW